MAADYEIRAAVGKDHAITVVGDSPQFNFTPSNPWVAIGWRKPAEIRIDAAPALAKHAIDFIHCSAEKVLPKQNQVRLADGRALNYDYLVITTGPRLAFDEVPGLGPETGFTQSVCTGGPSEKAWHAYEAFLKNPGPIVVGAMQGASCFGPAYEFAMNIDRLGLAFAGSMILLSAALAHFESPYWLLLTLFVGANLLRSAFTGYYPLAKILRMFGAKPGDAFSN